MSRKAISSVLLISVMLMLANGNDLNAQTMRTGRTIGTAGSSGMGMLGAQAAGYNPAILGLRINTPMSVNFPSIGISLGNNTFTPQYITDTFVEGDTLSDADKNEIIGKIEEDDLKVYGFLGVPVFGMSVESYALNFDVHGLEKTTLPSDIFRLLFAGPEQDVLYQFDSVKQEAMAYWTASLSAAKALTPPKYFSDFAVGATFKYIGGIGYGNVMDSNAWLQVTQDTVHAEGVFRYYRSISGDGVGLDLGVAGEVSSINTYVGLTLGNLIGSVNWDKVFVDQHTFNRHDGISIDSLMIAEYWEDFLHQTDSTLSVSSVRSNLPRYLLLSGSRPYFKNRGDVYLSWYQGLNDVPGQSTTPRVSLGTELRVIPLLPLRAGMAFGGAEGSVFAAGMGLNFGGFKINFGTSWQRGLLANAEGFSLALTIQIRQSRENRPVVEND